MGSKDATTIYKLQQIEEKEAQRDKIEEKEAQRDKIEEKEAQRDNQIEDLEAKIDEKIPLPKRRGK